MIELAYNLVFALDLHRLAGEIMVQGAGVLARSTLAYGLLAGAWTRDKEFSERRSPRRPLDEARDRSPHRAARGRALSRARRRARPCAAAAVRFVLANNIVSSAVLGPRSVEQLEDIVREVGHGAQSI